MSVLGFLKPTMISEVPENHFVVVHPLDDVAEHKVDTSALGPMPMTASVKLSLMALRGYLIVMVALVLYHVIDLAETLAQHTR
jgi:hypothetical protein